MDKDYVRKVGLSLSRSAAKGDESAVAKWATRALVEVNGLPEEPEVPFDAPPVDPAYFVPVGEAGDDVYIAGLEGGLPGEGVDWTLNRAIRWFMYVWTNGIDYHEVAPGLLPGSHCLTPEGYEFAVDFLKRDDLTVAPRDFNPLGLEVHP